MSQRQSQSKSISKCLCRVSERFNLIQIGLAFFEYTEVFVWGEDRNGQLGIDSQTKMLAQNGQRPSYMEVPRSCSFNIVIK